MYSLLALGLGATVALGQGAKGGEGHAGGSFEDGGNTQVSAMMVCPEVLVNSPSGPYNTPRCSSVTKTLSTFSTR